MCCNKTSFAAAHSFHTQNHGNLSVLVHPLTELDQEDHISRISWIGAPVVLDDECPCLYPSNINDDHDDDNLYIFTATPMPLITNKNML
jgi:hypothetical protein